MNADFTKLIKDFIAELSVTNSALRNQGAPGVIEAARQYLKDLDLFIFKVKDESSFQSVLNKETDSLCLKFPHGAKNWGAARKTLNLFLRDSLYNRYLYEYYGLQSLEPWLEVPLDNFVAKKLKKHPLGTSLPRWEGIKHLQPNQSAAYQEVASKIAADRGFARVHLDLLFWRQMKASLIG